MITNLRGYRCTGAEGFGADVSVGARIERKRGFRIAHTLRDALTERAGGEQHGGAFGVGWPFRLFEVSAAPADVLEEHDREIRARAFHVERELPLSDVFGPRAADVATLLDEVGHIRWLRSGGSGPSDRRVAGLVSEHYAALGDYMPVAPVPVHIVRPWHAARDVFNATVPWEQFICRNPAVRAVSLVIADTTMEGAFRIAMPIVNQAAFFGVFDGLWRAAGASVASSVKAFPLVDALLPGDQVHKIDIVTRSTQGLAAALGATYAPARSAAWQYAHNIYTDAPDELPDPLAHFADAVLAGRRAAAGVLRARPIHSANCPTCIAAPKEQDAIVMTLLEVTTQVVARIAAMAGRQFGWEVAYLLQDASQSDPWRPLLDLWRLGACPVGSTGDAFIVFVPEPPN